MAATIIVTGICAAGMVFMALVLCALHRHRPSNHRCRVEQILSHNAIDWRL